MRNTRFRIYGWLVTVMAALMAMLTACANMSGSPGGGPKDELPPVMVAAVPLQGATDFQDKQVLMEFDEFIELRDVDRIYVSPVLKNVEYSYNLKKVKVLIGDTLRPDYTYTIRFGNSLVDLHEANPIPDFQYVFSTGAAVDSMFLEGRVVKAVDYQPEDRVRLLFYMHRPDSFPFADEPDYVAVGDKDGYFQVRHMKAGCYFVYGVVDDNQDYRIDPVTERMAYTDTCFTALKMISLPETIDSLALLDSLTWQGALAGVMENEMEDGKFPDMGGSVSLDTLVVVDDTIGPSDSLAAFMVDSVPEVEPMLELYLYQDYLPDFFLKEVAFKQRGQLDMQFYYPMDSAVSVTYLVTSDTVSEERHPLMVWQWREDRRQATVFFNDHAFYEGDIVFSFRGYTDTVSVYLPENKRLTDTAMFRLSELAKKVSVTDTLKWKSDMPLLEIDTAAMEFWQLVGRTEAVCDTLWLSDTLPATADSLGMVAETLLSADSIFVPDTSSMPLEYIMELDTLMTIDTFFTADSVWACDTVYHIDTLYRDAVRGLFRLRDTMADVTDTLPMAFDIVRLDDWSYGVIVEKEVPGKYVLFLKDSAVYDYLGRPNDTSVCSWETVFPEENAQVGDLALEISGLDSGAVYVLQMVEGKNKVVQTVRLTDTGMVEFLALKPGMYTFWLLKDDNDNGRWDEGDYVRRIQPEKHWYYHKTLRVEADWRIEDVWDIK